MKKLKKNKFKSKFRAISAELKILFNFHSNFTQFNLNLIRFNSSSFLFQF